MFKVPVRRPGIVEINLGSDDAPEVRKIDLYKAKSLYEITAANLIAECDANGSIATESEHLQRWAASLFRQDAELWCPESAAALWSYCQEQLDALKKKVPDLNSPVSPSSTAPTPSQPEPVATTDHTG